MLESPMLREQEDFRMAYIDAGIPAQAILLLRDGCHDTAANIDEVREKLDLLSK